MEQDIPKGKNDNLVFLENRLYYLGFGGKLKEQLEDNIRTLQPKFQLDYSAVSKGTNNQEKAIDFKLDFSKSKQNDNYFFNKYQATLKDPADPAKDKTHTFYIENGKGVTSKEAFNLLDGRAVHKELKKSNGETYNTWLQFDLNQKDDKNQFKVNTFHEKYGYNLEKAVNAYDVKGMDKPEWRKNILESLEKGNITKVAFNGGGQESTGYLVANPKDHNVMAYDEHMVRIGQGIREHKEEKKEKQQENGKDQSDEQNKGKTNASVSSTESQHSSTSVKQTPTELKPKASENKKGQKSEADGTKKSTKSKGVGV